MVSNTTTTTDRNHPKKGSTGISNGDTGNGDGSGGSGCGMSRAAMKKRKKQQQQQQQQRHPASPSLSPNSIIRENNNSITRLKNPPPPSRENDGNQLTESNNNNKKKKKMKVAVVDDTSKRSKMRLHASKEMVHDECNDDEDYDDDNGEDVNDTNNFDINDNGDDEIVPMKTPASMNQDDDYDDDDGKEDDRTTTDHLQQQQSLLPNDCRSLYDLLLLDDSERATTSASDGSSNESVLQQQLSEMTIEQRAQCALELLLQPSNVTKDQFMDKYYEKLPLHCCSSNSSTTTTMNTLKNLTTTTDSKHLHAKRYDKIFTIHDLRTMIETKTLYYGTDLNVTRYELSKQKGDRKSNSSSGVYRRVTLDKKSSVTNEYEIAQLQDVWEMYSQHNCTIRLLCPQQYNNTIYTLLSLLEFVFHCMVGANIYCTPPNASQGFAPHYDDIDAYIVQLEGYKRWKVYKPIQKHERLPRTSSKDYTHTDFVHIEPYYDVILQPGDMLYIPRGWIHQACTISTSEMDHLIQQNNTTTTSTTGSTMDTHSLHLTISTMQQWAWADYMEVLLPEALEACIHSSTSTMFRQGLPTGFVQYMGAMYDNRTELLPDILQSKLETEDDGNATNDNAIEDSDTVRNNSNKVMKQRRVLQEEFRTQTKRRLMKVVHEAMNMIDATCDQMGKRFLSDRLPPALTTSEKERTNQSSSSVRHLTSTMMCQLVRPGIARLVLEDDMAIVCHCCDNSRVYHEKPISPMEFEMDDAPSIEQLLTTVPPYWIAIADLIHDTIDDKIGVAQALYDEGILAIRQG